MCCLGRLDVLLDHSLGATLKDFAAPKHEMRPIEQYLSKNSYEMSFNNCSLVQAGSGLVPEALSWGGMSGNTYP